MVDILYIVGKGFSDWHDNELRYSLRSIAENGRNVGRVFVCGYCPFWLNPDTVTLVPLRDEDTRKHINILRAIEHAIDTQDISERFLYSSDDHYYVQPTDFETYPAYWRGRDIYNENVPQRDWYKFTCKSTHDVLAAFGLPVRMYAWHGNTWFNTRLWQQQRMTFLRRMAQTMPEGCEPTCLMLNYWATVEPESMPQQVVRPDGKVTSAHTIDDIDRLAAEKEVLSSTDAVGATLRTWLQRRFPKKCKYEK